MYTHLKFIQKKQLLKFQELLFLITNRQGLLKSTIESKS